MSLDIICIIFFQKGLAYFFKNSTLIIYIFVSDVNGIFSSKNYIFCLLLLYSHAFQNCPALSQGGLAFIPHIYQLLAEDCPQELGVTL